MKNLEFLEKIKYLDFTIGGSFALKKQIPDFRKSDDIDIMINYNNFDKVVKELNKLSLSTRVENENRYGKYEIHTVYFSDKSKIDFIIRNEKIKYRVKIEGYNYLLIKSIIYYKFELLFNGLNKNLNNKNKHLIDLFYLYKTGYLFDWKKTELPYEFFLDRNKLTKSFFIKEKKEEGISIEDIPF